MSAVKGGGFSPRLPAPVEKTPEQKFREVSSLYEKQFMREMVKAMRATVPESGLIPVSQGERIFREQLDDSYVDSWSARGGVGFADIIYEQLMDKFGHLTGRGRMAKPQGPLPLTEKDQSSIRFQVHAQKDTKKMDVTLRASEGGWKENEILAPWSGKVTKNISLGNEQRLIELDHGQGLLGRFVFKGWSEDLSPNTEVASGQKIGRLNKDSEALYWSLRDGTQESGPGGPKSHGESL